MEKLRYVCVAKELGSIDTIRRIHIQIIQWEKESVYECFMDEYLGKFLPFCDCYVKTRLNFIEYGLFHGSKGSGATKQWPGITGKGEITLALNLPGVTNYYSDY
ncbi:unnamed protein product [Rotaria magnacalcarata]|uniref:Uncharacterized protein n=2 Tax=Rotaria magnacalcarata TaxID=392030 RepID=A0A820CW07_9BILA|nr:unnamed protein product [Rotaria magnacalcarata]CAF4090476.1 unnamed protein product [Rotaria magnacalcarata]CAF4110761.1 unnamed protein product [Rotaria magnacalcarata]CAF4223868.1 unnamed protein product [Rotaria magnacalcarata]